MNHIHMALKILFKNERSVEIRVITGGWQPQQQITVPKVKHRVA